jgi:hypothetical protein
LWEPPAIDFLALARQHLTFTDNHGQLGKKCIRRGWSRRPGRHVVGSFLDDCDRGLPTFDQIWLYDIAETVHLRLCWR